MNLLTIPLPTLRRALELAEEREALVEELNSLFGARARMKSLTVKSRSAKRTNQGARRYWREWRKKKEAENAAQS